MDDKTESLRDLFVDVAGAETVTERQEDDRGSLADESRIDHELEQVVARMRNRFDFDTRLPNDALVRIVHGYFAGESDASIARALDVSRGAVGRARLDLHLLRDHDMDAPFDLERLGAVLDATDSVDAAAAELDVSPSTVRRYRRVYRVANRVDELDDRYRDAFAAVLDDRSLSTHLTETIREQGLEDATADAETDSGY